MRNPVINLIQLNDNYFNTHIYKNSSTMANPLEKCTFEKQCSEIRFLVSAGVEKKTLFITSKQ